MVGSPQADAQQTHVVLPEPRQGGSGRPTTHDRPVVRDPEDKSDPVELLLDITFVALLNQASSLLFLDSSPAGILNALSVLLVALLFWQMTAAATGIVPVNGVMRALYLAKTGAFLLMAASVRQAFTRDSGGTGMPWLFAAATTVAGVCSVVMWVYLGSRDRRWRGNASLLVGFAVVMTACVWAAELGPARLASRWLLVGYGVSMALCSNTALPFPRRFGIGSRVRLWAINGARAYRERYTTSYVVGCCLCLQLLEVLGDNAWDNEAMPISALVLVAVALNVSLMMYWLYEPLIDPARRAVDPRNPEMSQTRKVAHSLGDVYGHLLMFAGLVLTAGALRAVFTELVDSHGSAFGPAAGTETLLELFGGIAMCLLGQALFSWFTLWRLDLLRLGAVGGMLALVPLLGGAPVLLAVLLLPPAVGVVYLLDRWRRRGVKSTVDRVKRRIWVQRTERDHQVSGFELFFDFMAAFAFAQVTNIVLRNPSVSGVLHAGLILGSIYGCWLTYCWAANNARADRGTLRQFHVIALFGLILLSLTLPGAFTHTGLNRRVLLFLCAYLVIRLASAAALYCLFGRAVTRRALVIIGFGSAATVCIAVAVQLGGSAGVTLWAVAVGCEIVAIAASASGMHVRAPAHLAERFAFLVVLGLDMSLSGVCERFAGARIGVVHVALIAAALLVCTLMWWLYFDTLVHYAEHQLDRTDAKSRPHRRFVHTHYNGLHLVILAGMVSFGFGLRFIAEHTTTEHTGPLGPDLTPLTAASLTVGLTGYLVGITMMWSLLRRPTVFPWLVAAAVLAVTPVLIGRPAIEGLAVLIGVAGLPVLAHALTPGIRGHRHSARQVSQHAG
ncbi:MAG TPA: low temperature requirement protein A [Pseudonocardiaceae bacterium]|jgi:low temperature requirement protein LtrA|nr:low temperature requirement protein A [Pseudonocardiaceae bacterium]